MRLKPGAAADAAAATRTVRCPACGHDAVYGPANPWRPFCSERCRQHDLGAWASEGYRVPAQPAAADDEPPAAAGPH